jgi:hypothetical protein
VRSRHGVTKGVTVCLPVNDLQNPSTSLEHSLISLIRLSLLFSFLFFPTLWFALFM